MNVFEKRCIELDKAVNDLSHSEKEFLLWKLLDYHRDGLLDDIKFVPRDDEDIRIQAKMRRHIDACEEIREEIRKRIF